MKLTPNHPDGIEFALQTGKLIQNFGIVERTTYHWIGALSESDIAVEISMHVPLATRIGIILKLIEKKPDFLDADKRAKAIAHWKQLKDKGCELRNTVAHGTIGLMIPGPDGTAPATTSGILKLQKWSDTDQLLSLEELKEAVNVTSSIIWSLNEILGDA